MGVFNIKWVFLLMFLIGLSMLALGVYSQGQEQYVVENDSPVERAQNTNIGDLLDSFVNTGAEELPSPCNRVSEDQIFVYKDRIVIDFANAEWATFTDTNSMDPVIDSGANAIEYVPKTAEEICVGDIASYESKYADGILIHRVVETGYDNDGWYAIMKGDNNSYRDPGKIRFDQIKRVVVAIIY